MYPNNQNFLMHVFLGGKVSPLPVSIHKQMEYTFKQSYEYYWNSSWTSSHVVGVSTQVSQNPVGGGVI